MRLLQYKKVGVRARVKDADIWAIKTLFGRRHGGEHITVWALDQFPESADMHGGGVYLKGDAA